MLFRTLAFLLMGLPAFAGFIGSGYFSKSGASSGVPASASHVAGTTTYTYAWDFLGATDPGTGKPVLKTGAVLTVDDLNGVPGEITQVQLQSTMQFNDVLSVVDPGPKIALTFDVSTLQSADPAFDWARTRFSVWMAGYDINGDSVWGKEQFFSITNPGASSATFTFSNLAGPGAPGIGGNDIPNSVVSFALSIALTSDIAYSNSGGSPATSATASVDAMHSLVVQSMQSLDENGDPLAGFAFASAEGASYSAVPEPGSFLLVCAAALLLTALRGRSA